VPLPYLSPRRFRRSGFGIDVSGMTDAELNRHLTRATATVNTYCNMPTLPSEYDFRGGSIADERHEWHLGDPLLITQGTRRVYVYHRPITSITSFVVDFTNNYTVTIAPSDLYVNNIEGWAEVVSLAAVVTGIYPIGINFGLYTPVARVSYTYGWTFSVAGDELYIADGNTYEATYGNWTTSPTPVIYVNGVAAGSGYSINYGDGTVLFSPNLGPADVVTADYTHTVPSAIEEATGIIALDSIGRRAIAARGMQGLTSIKIAELSLTQKIPMRYLAKNGVSIPEDAGALLESYTHISGMG
jgi:hypothetical protein